MNRHHEGRPENGRSDGEVIIEVPGVRVLTRVNGPIGVDPAHGETFVPGSPVVLEIQLVLDQQRTEVGVIADAVAPDPRVEQGQRQQEQEEERLGASRIADFRLSVSRRIAERRPAWGFVNSRLTIAD